MVEAWHSRGVGAYYGYAFENFISTTVDDDFCREVEAILITRLAQDNDTTGIAYLSFANTFQYDEKLVRPKILGLDVSVHKEYLKFRRAVGRVGGDTNIPLYFLKFFSGSYKYGCLESFIDERDGQEYKAVCIGDQVWMAENLNYASPNSRCFNHDPAICDVFGRLYDYFDVIGNNQPVDRYAEVGVQGICPEGWHIPSHKEWMELERTFGMPESELDIISGAEAANRGALANVGQKLKSEVHWATPAIPGVTNESGLSLKPGGIGGGQDFFVGTGLYGHYWSSSTGEVTTDNFQVIRRLFNDEFAGVSITYSNIHITTKGTYYLSCRCVKDKDEE